MGKQTQRGGSPRSNATHLLLLEVLVHCLFLQDGLLSLSLPFHFAAPRRRPGSQKSRYGKAVRGYHTDRSHTAISRLASISLSLRAFWCKASLRSCSFFARIWKPADGENPRKSARPFLALYIFSPFPSPLLDQEILGRQNRLSREVDQHPSQPERQKPKYRQQVGCWRLHPLIVVHRTLEVKAEGGTVVRRKPPSEQPIEPVS